jgi:prepilin-type N-terminal cleavage/methylation domain-containing protein
MFSKPINDERATGSSELRTEAERPDANAVRGQEGFSLIEVAVAMVVVLIALLGVFFTLTYAITYNAGNNSRAQALAVLQAEVERLRSLKFTPNLTDADLQGGVRPVQIVVSPNGGTFGVRVFVDNDPDTTGIQNETDVPNPTIKEIEVQVRLEHPSPGWQAAVPATIVMRRVRSN